MTDHLVTAAFDAQDALYALISPLTALAAWDVNQGLPDRRSERNVWVDDQIDEWTREEATTGLVAQQETFTLHVYLWSTRLDCTQVELRDEIATAAASIQTALAADRTLGDVVMLAGVTGSSYDGGFLDDAGRERIGVLKLDITCTAWLE